MEARCSTPLRHGVCSLVALPLIHLLYVGVEAGLAQVLQAQLGELIDPALGQGATLHGQVQRVHHVKIKFKDSPLADFFYSIIYSIDYGRLLIRRYVLVLYLAKQRDYLLGWCLE